MDDEDHAQTFPSPGDDDEYTKCIDLGDQRDGSGVRKNDDRPIDDGEDPKDRKGKNYDHPSDDVEDPEKTEGNNEDHPNQSRGHASNGQSALLLQKLQ